MATTPTPMPEAEVVREATRRLLEVLPPSWSGELVAQSAVGALRRNDAELTVRAPSGVAATIPIEAKRIIEGRDVATIAEGAGSQTGLPGSDLIVMARYLPATVRDRLTDAGLSWADATGNVRVSLTWPGLFIFNRGADSDPWRGPGRPKGTLKGEPAAKVVRALIDFDRDWSMRDLVEASRASTGATYRVIEFLDEEGLVERINSRVVARDWQSILRRWSADYSFTRTNQTSKWIAPRGIDDVLARARETSDLRYAITSTVAASRWAPYAPPRSLMVYAESAAEIADAWGLRTAEGGTNVVLAQPNYDVVFERAEAWDGVTIAAPSQVVVDLLTGPGRNPSEAEELINWMSRNEPVWRR
ncbi:type IV toxin-antitoxin system AbiEi family antitoxin [Microbacterium pumilum]|uniref:HTH iclR-type domain-containing protein n=1 Tax=Microbacterium pumilum TaxID=344165 RepID=A0ABP5DS01_9MICO